MGFNYAKERRKFEAEWRKLRQEYEQAGMEPNSIEEIYLSDLAEFRSRRRFEIRTQPLPDMYESDEGASQSFLLRKHKALSTTFDEADFFGEAAWLDTIEDPTLLTGLRKLTQKDLKLLQFIVLEGYTQEDLAQKWHCSQSSISKRFLRIKEFLRNFPK